MSGPRSRVSHTTFNREESGTILAHIVHLTTVHKPRDNRVFHKECKALADAGYRVTLVATDAGTKPVEGVEMYHLPSPGGRLKRLTLSQVRAWKALRELKPDLLQIHDPELIPLAFAWKKLHKTPVIYDAHEDLVGQIEDKRYLKPALKKAARAYAKFVLNLADRRFDAILAATPIIAAKFQNQKKVVLYNYPWLADFPKIERNEVPGRVIYLGWLTVGRQFNEMWAAVKLVDDAEFVCAGYVDSTAKADLERAIGQDGFDYRGVLAPAELPELLATGSLGLVFLQPLPNYMKSLPTKLFEYMAAEVPFVASDFPYWREMFEDADAGVFVDSANSEQAAAVITELLQDRERRAEMGRNGRKVIEEKFNFEKEAPKLIALVEELLGGRG